MVFQYKGVVGQKPKLLDLWIHFVTNVLSTLLLDASYCTMQCLSSTTRSEVDKAHRRRITLDIGMPSLNNLRRISWTRIVLWWLLALSSVPLHLISNGVVICTISTNPYIVAVVSEDFLAGASYGNRTYLESLPKVSPEHLLWKADFKRLANQQNSALGLENLGNDACLKAYHKDFTSDRGDVLAISSAISNTSFLNYENSPFDLNMPPYHWTCNTSGVELIGPDCFVNAAEWSIESHPIEYCLSVPVEGNCELQISLPILIIVLTCKFAQALCMILVFWMPFSRDPYSTPLLTLGDAVATFLHEPDANTAQNFLASKYCFQRRM